MPGPIGQRRGYFFCAAAGAVGRTLKGMLMVRIESDGVKGSFATRTSKPGALTDKFE